jgi:hypothetical protein
MTTPAPDVIISFGVARCLSSSQVLAIEAALGTAIGSTTQPAEVVTTCGISATGFGYLEQRFGAWLVPNGQTAAEQAWVAKAQGIALSYALTPFRFFVAATTIVNDANRQFSAMPHAYASNGTPNFSGPYFLETLSVSFNSPATIALRVDGYLNLFPFPNAGFWTTLAANYSVALGASGRHVVACSQSTSKGGDSFPAEIAIGIDQVLNGGGSSTGSGSPTMGQGCDLASKLPQWVSAGSQVALFDYGTVSVDSAGFAAEGTYVLTAAPAPIP